MIHYSCDRCRRAIDTRHELRYCVQIEIQAEFEGDDIDLDDDHLGELNAMLESLEDSQREELSNHAYQKKQFDLCPECHGRYVKNPLAADVFAKTDFSEN